MAFTLKYNLKEAGWADVEIRSGEERVEIVVSYLHDTLRELAEAARALSKGSDLVPPSFCQMAGQGELFIDFRVHFLSPG